MKIAAGELVCRAEYMDKLPRARRWYYPVQENAATLVRMQQVLHADLPLQVISAENPLPHSVNGVNRIEATHFGARRINNNDHEALLDENSRRDRLDYIEDVEASTQEEGLSESMGEEEASNSEGGDSDKNSD